MDVAFKYLISEYYSRDMSIKTKSAKYAKMQRGEYQSKICPYGYRKSADGRMEPDPEAAAVVQLIFQLAAEGNNGTSIARELFRRDIPTPGEYKAARGNHTHDISRTRGIWSPSTVLRILEDERYIGSYVIGKRAVLEVGGTRSRMKDRDKWYIIPDHHPAIVEKSVFEKVQTSQLRFSQPNKKKRDYPLKGKAFCGCCGHALSRTMQKTSYYYCRHSEADEESRCHKMRVNAVELEKAVFITLKKQMEAAASLNPDGTVRLEAAAPERSEYEQQIEELQEGKRLLYERYLLGEIDLETYKAEKAACDELLLKTKNLEFSSQPPLSALNYHIVKSKPLIAVGADALFDFVRIDALQIIVTCTIEIIGTSAAETNAHCSGLRLDQPDTYSQGAVHTTGMSQIQGPDIFP